MLLRRTQFVMQPRWNSTSSWKSSRQIAQPLQPSSRTASAAESKTGFSRPATPSIKFRTICNASWKRSGQSALPPRRHCPLRSGRSPACRRSLPQETLLLTLVLHCHCTAARSLKFFTNAARSLRKLCCCLLFFVVAGAVGGLWHTIVAGKGRGVHGLVIGLCAWLPPNLLCNK